MEREDAAAHATGQALLIAISATDPSTTTETIDRRLAEIRDRVNYEIAWGAIEGILRSRPIPNPDLAYATQLKVAEKALSEELSDPEKDTWLYRKSDALANSGDYESALAVLEQLAQRRPRDAGVKLRIARAVTRLHEADDPETALANWRRLAVQLKPHTDSWYEAKYNVAKLLKAAGKPEAARKVLEHLKAIPPGWENSKLKSEFEQLLKQFRQ